MLAKGGADIIKRFIGSLSQQDWTAVFIELMVVVVGILLALQVDQWAQGREQRETERTYLLRLKEDLQIERARASDAMGFARSRLEAVQYLDRVAADPSIANKDTARLPWAIETAGWRSFPKISPFVYDELQSTGRMSLIRSVALRRALVEHYATIAHDGRVGEDRSAEQAFDQAAAGLLSMGELTAIERVGGQQPIDMSEDRARVLANGLAARRQAIDQLPSLAQHHVFNLRVIGDMQERIDRLIAMVDRELAR